MKRTREAEPESAAVLDAASYLDQIDSRRERRRIARLEQNVRNLETQLVRAKERAHGSGRRNEQGFRERGCGCRTCVARVGRIQEKLDAALEKYQEELFALGILNLEIDLVEAVPQAAPLLLASGA